MCDIHNLVSEPFEQCSLQRLGKEIRNHFLCARILDFNLSRVDSILHEEVTNVHVTSTVIRRATFFRQSNSGLVILMDNGLKWNRPENRTFKCTVFVSRVKMNI